MTIKVYVRKGKTQDDKEFTAYSAKSKQGKWCTIVFAKDCEKPEVSSEIEIDNHDIFKSTNPLDKQETYVIMKVIGMKPIVKEVVEEDYFF